jgi:hypothetical protein
MQYFIYIYIYIYIYILHLLQYAIKYKPNSITHQKDHPSLSSWFHSRDVAMFQHTQINQYNAAYKQKEGKKSHDNLNRFRKVL